MDYGASPLKNKAVSSSYRTTCHPVNDCKNPISSDALRACCALEGCQEAPYPKLPSEGVRSKRYTALSPAAVASATTRSKAQQTSCNRFPLSIQPLSQTILACG